MPIEMKKEKVLKVPKIIIYTAQVLQLLSTKATIMFVARIFKTPIRHKMPKRELEMDRNSRQTLLPVPSLNQKVMVYEYGDSPQKILLVHGWSGRGTQLVKIADALIKQGYSTVSFDAPAHGKSTGNATLMNEFIASVWEIDKQYGPFEAAIGHSLGGMTLLKTINEGLQINKLAIIGSGDKVINVIEGFVAKLKLNPKYVLILRNHFEKKLGQKMSNYDGFLSAQSIAIPVLVIHDQDDSEVPASASINIDAHLKNSQLILTNNLGHRKILGDTGVVTTVVKFVTS
jgi:pimeloyl-ACP methyl ester carboxylesterase